MKSLKAQYNDLLEAIKRHKKLAVAFSGGVDSTLLVHAALQSLGEENVLVLHARSTLISEWTMQNTKKVSSYNFPAGVNLKEIELFPLRWKEFVENSNERCYFCKKRMYSHFISVMVSEGYSALADGTNSDDLKKNRPGLRAIRELKVITPFVEVDMTKKHIRLLARMNGLSNHDLPSNSCMASRVQKNEKIDEKKLRTIESAEFFLQELGFWGCRVKPQQAFTVVEVQDKDIVTFIDHKNRVMLLHFFKTLGLKPVVLSLEGR